VKSVVVTGASGHIGYAVVRELVEGGYNVRAGMRGVDNQSKAKRLRELGVELFECDMMRPETLRPAFEGAHGLFHLAAVFKIWVKDDHTEAIEPTVQGGLNVLESAAKAGIQRVVFTSSAVAVGLQAPADRPLTEADWDHSEDRHAYCYAKTRGEAAAWELARERGLNMVSICPGHVLGPYIYRHTPTTTFFQKIMDNELPGALPMEFFVVDVRDVARAHVLAYQNDQASGRYIAMGGRGTPMTELIELMREFDPGIKVKAKVLPGPVISLAMYLDFMAHVLTGRPREITRALLKEFTNKARDVRHQEDSQRAGMATARHPGVREGHVGLAQRAPGRSLPGDSWVMCEALVLVNAAHQLGRNRAYTTSGGHAPEAVRPRHPFARAAGPGEAIVVSGGVCGVSPGPPPARAAARH
jgi:dihydroflavonol-4-reductase